MRDFDETNLTDEVLRRFDGTPDPRLRQVMQSLVRHLHAFVREVELTPEEWATAIGFLTRTGQISVGGRQEVILLSDTLGVSMLVDAINNRGEGVTPSTVLGPFFVEGAPEYPQGADISRGVAGEPLFVDVEMLSEHGAPLAGASVDVWQSDTDGFYDVQRNDRPEPTLRGRFTTDAGRLRFWTILPTAYPIPDDGPVGEMLAATKRHPWRPAHLHFIIAAPGCRTLTTHVFVDGDAYLDSDVVFGVKSSLIDAFPEQPAGAAPDGRRMDGPWRLLNYSFRLAARPDGLPSALV